MSKANRTFKVATCAVVLALFASAAPAFAVAVDSNVYAEYSARKNSLINKERGLQRDYDEIQHRLDELNRKNDGSLNGQINELAGRLDKKYSDLRRVQQDIKDVELKLL